MAASSTSKMFADPRLSYHLPAWNMLSLNGRVVVDVVRMFVDKSIRLEKDALYLGLACKCRRVQLGGSHTLICSRANLRSVVNFEATLLTKS